MPTDCSESPHAAWAVTMVTVSVVFSGCSGGMIPSTDPSPETPAPSSSFASSPSGPVREFQCRRPTVREMKLAGIENKVLNDRPQAVVDIDSTWRLVAYWFDNGVAGDGSRMIMTNVIVTNGKRFNYVGFDWNGKYQAAGESFVDGPAANIAVRKCIGDPKA